MGEHPAEPVHADPGSAEGTREGDRHAPKKAALRFAKVNHDTRVEHTPKHDVGNVANHHDLVRR